MRRRNLCEVSTICEAAEAIIGRGHKWTNLEKVQLPYTHCFRNRTHCTSGQVFDKEEFKEVCKKVQKPLEMPRVFTQSQRSTGRSKPWQGGVEDKECKGRGGTQLQHPSATVINDRGISQQPSKHCELTMNRCD